MRRRARSRSKLPSRSEVNSLWIDLAASTVVQRMAPWPWRLGLGWLIGRRLVLVSTHSPQQAIRRTLVPGYIVDGDILLAGLADAHWHDDVDTRPIANTQAHPGPLAVKIRPVNNDEATDGVRWYLATATGGVAPDMVPPDKMWLWALVPIAWWLARRA